MLRMPAPPAPLLCGAEALLKPCCPTLQVPQAVVHHAHVRRRGPARLRAQQVRPGVATLGTEQAVAVQPHTLCFRELLARVASMGVPCRCHPAHLYHTTLHITALQPRPTPTPLAIPLSCSVTLRSPRLECQRVFEELLAGEPRLVVAPGTTPRLGLICFQLAGASEAEAEALLEAINATGARIAACKRLGGVGWTIGRCCSVLARRPAPHQPHPSPT